MMQISQKGGYLNGRKSLKNSVLGFLFKIKIGNSFY
jgi:hypothetical protein